MEEKFIELGGEKLKLNINFRNCYSLTKYRNKIATGIDLSGASQEILDEISNLELDKNRDIKFTNLSKEAQEFLIKQSTDKNELFTDKDIIFILKLLTGKSEEEILILLDKEIQETSYDEVINKMIKVVNEVFTSAKGGQSPKVNEKE